MASEYGWSKQDIYEDVYFDELYYLVKRIEKRQMAQYRMQLAIVQNPHIKEPEKLWTLLKDETQEYVRRPDVAEPGAFDILKGALRGSPRFIVK